MGTRNGSGPRWSGCRDPERVRAAREAPHGDPERVRTAREAPHGDPERVGPAPERLPRPEAGQG